MNAMTIMLTIWIALTGVLIALMIYRSTLALHEDTHLYLEAQESMEEKEQHELDRKLGRLTPIVNTLGALSGALILAIIGQFLYTGLSS